MRWTRVIELHKEENQRRKRSVDIKEKYYQHGPVGQDANYAYVSLKFCNELFF